MTGTMTTTGNHALTAGTDPYAAYGAKSGPTGLYLSFKNGEFLAGQNGEVVPIGTRLAANMAGLRIGWKCWKDSRVADEVMQFLADGMPAMRRSDLGDEDRSKWEVNDDGTPRDPWQFTNELTLADGKGQQYIFSTSSRGGTGAISKLCAEYSELRRQRGPGMVPIVELANDFYIHPKYKKTYVPVFNIALWADENTLAVEEEEKATEPSPKAKVAAPGKPKF